ncbi:MAG: TspO/MBR family protein [Armatimonadota bacterium]
MGRTAVGIGLLGWLAVSLLAGAIGSSFTAHSVTTWYLTLAKPSWTPPGWVFAPVWTTLYLLMGVAAWLVWRQHGFRASALPLTLFLVQLALNALWSLLFFGLRRPGLAFGEIVVLWCSVLATGFAFWSRRRSAGYLLAPYLAWASFALLLNLSIWRLNR